jgi:hypothetical protein
MINPSGSRCGYFNSWKVGRYTDLGEGVRLANREARLDSVLYILTIAKSKRSGTSKFLAPSEA